MNTVLRSLLFLFLTAAASLAGQRIDSPILSGTIRISQVSGGGTLAVTASNGLIVIAGTNPLLSQQSSPFAAAMNQGVATGDSPSFSRVTTAGDGGEIWVGVSSAATGEVSIELGNDGTGSFSGELFCDSLNIASGIDYIGSDGSASFANGGILLNTDGSASFANGALGFNADGSLDWLFLGGASEFRLSGDSSDYIVVGGCVVNGDGSASFGYGTVSAVAGAIQFGTGPNGAVSYDPAETRMSLLNSTASTGFHIFDDGTWAVGIYSSYSGASGDDLYRDSLGNIVLFNGEYIFTPNATTTFNGGLASIGYGGEIYLEGGAITSDGSGTLTALGGFSGPIFVESSGAAPSSPVTGQIYFDASGHHFYGYDGTAWKQLDN